MDWASAAVGLAGVTVAGASVVFTWLTYRPRSAYQERVYERQLDAYGEIIRRLGELHEEVQRVLARSGPRVDEAELRLRTREPAEAFFQAYREWRVFLTRRISEPIHEYLRTLGVLSSEDDPHKALDGAFENVARAASKALGVDVLSVETSALFGDDAVLESQLASGDSVTLLAALWYERTFEDFRPENTELRSGTIVAGDSDLGATRDDVYQNNRNVFLVHTWRPSELPRQVADISIRLKEHPRQHGPSENDRPLTRGLVEKVEYKLGDKWFGGRTVVKTNAEEDFKLDVSAYGPALCLARVHFKDGGVVLLDRYLDFADVRRSEASG